MMVDFIREKGTLLFVLAIVICCNADNLAASKPRWTDEEKEIVLKKRYLNMPVQNNVPKQLYLYHLWGGVQLSKLEIYELKSIWE
jgi:hypothetical protein